MKKRLIHDFLGRALMLAINVAFIIMLCVNVFKYPMSNLEIGLLTGFFVVNMLTMFEFGYFTYEERQDIRTGKEEDKEKKDETER